MLPHVDLAAPRDGVRALHPPLPPIEEPGGKGTGPGCLVSVRSLALRARRPEARAGPARLADCGRPHPHPCPPHPRRR